MISALMPYSVGKQHGQRHCDDRHFSEERQELKTDMVFAQERYQYASEKGEKIEDDCYANRSDYECGADQPS